MTPRRILSILAIAAAICGIAFLFYLASHNPETSPAPQCVFHRLTGLLCPGCGSQRAFHAIANGRLADAWHYNAAVFFAVPLAGIYIAGPRRLRLRMLHPAVLLTIAALLILWTIARNLSPQPFLL